MQIGFPQKSTFSTITATKIICPELDSGADDLVLKRAGTTHLSLIAGRIRAEQRLRLHTGIRIEDAGGNVIIRGDGTGHIDQIGRMDAPVTSPAGSHEVMLTPQELVGLSQSGTLSEGVGDWRAVANDALYLYLNTIFGFLALKGTVHINSITVYINSTDNTAFMTDCAFRRYLCTSGAYVDEVRGVSDLGNGSTGDENGVLTVNTALVTGHYYQFTIYGTVGAGTLIIRSIKIKYHLT